MEILTDMNLFSLGKNIDTNEFHVNLERLIVSLITNIPLEQRFVEEAIF